eukprot:6204549-Pleurochrysis_carterae.AAC.2
MVLLLNVYVDDILLLDVYVDDILTAYANGHRASKDWFVGEYTRTYNVHDMGKVHMFMGIEICQLQDCVKLTQTRYIKKMFDKSCAGVNTKP